MNWWKKGFEIALWNSRFVVLLAVVTSVLAGVALFCIFGIESLRVLANVFHYLDPTMVLEQREALLRESVLRLISLIDGYLLGHSCLSSASDCMSFSYRICRRLVRPKRLAEFCESNP